MGVTPAFWGFVLAVPVLGVAALNTGNNSLYLLLALTLGMFVASGVLSRHVLAALRVTASLDTEPYASTPTRVRLAVKNGSAWLPASGVVCRMVGLPGSVVVPTVPPRGEATTVLTTALPSRGRHQMPSVEVEVRLPLGFFVKSVKWPQEGEVVVFPRLLRGGAARWVAMSRSQVTALRGAGRSGGEVDHLREFRSGDDHRHIHWKQTARQQRTIVMERRERAADSRFLVLDRQVPVGDAEVMRARFEDLVSEVASAAVVELRRGDSVGLIVGSTIMPPASGRRHLRRLLEHLALVEAVSSGVDPLPLHVGRDGIYRLVEGR